ncbi:squalene/phytoene synthase family protein [Nesterenkonia massiliensis]|uniref:squalene/phytoene synthase family protein n=1 Tax=Nesterenkonia massiliensis TaxID=1232429 RepID=UPI0030B86350
MHPPQPSSGLDLYSRAAAEAASRVIREYSTSFQLATRLLPGQQRADIRSVYALVRVADEIVDGTAEEAGLGPGSRPFAAGPAGIGGRLA